MKPRRDSRDVFAYAVVAMWALEMLGRVLS
jgi:hypothetical protein